MIRLFGKTGPFNFRGAEDRFSLCDETSPNRIEQNLLFRISFERIVKLDDFGLADYEEPFIDVQTLWVLR